MTPNTVLKVFSTKLHKRPSEESGPALMRLDVLLAKDELTGPELGELHELAVALDFGRSEIQDRLTRMTTQPVN